MSSPKFSDQAILTAVRALTVEMKRCNAKVQDKSLSEEDSDYFFEYLGTLDLALGEFEAAYSLRQVENPGLTPLDLLRQSIQQERD